MEDFLPDFDLLRPYVPEQRSPDFRHNGPPVSDNYLPDFDLIGPSVPESVPNVDSAQASADQWLDKNPLSRVRFNQPIHDLVSLHLSHDHVSPFKSTNVRSNAAKMFYVSFFLGLLTTEKVKKRTGIITVFKRKTLNKLELVVVYGDEKGAALHVHDIDFGGVFGDVDVQEHVVPNRRRLEEFVKSKLRSDLEIEHFAEVKVHKYKLVEQATNLNKDNVRFGMIKMDDHVEEVEASGEVDFDPYEPARREWGIQHRNEWKEFEEEIRSFSAIENEPRIEDLRAIVKYALRTIYSFKNLVHSMPEYTHPASSGDDIGFLHGVLFSLLPDGYYTRSMSNELQLIHYNEGAAQLYLVPTFEMPNEHVLVVLDTSRITIHDGYSLLEYLKNKEKEPKISEIRYFFDETGATLDGQRLRTLEWSINNAMKNLHLDALEATEADKAQFKANYDHYYSKIIDDIKTNDKFGHLIDSLDSIKSFIFGQLKTNPNLDAKILVDPRPNKPFGAMKIMQNTLDDFNYIVTFNDKYDPPAKPIEHLINEHSSTNKFRLNFRFVDGKTKFVVTSMNEVETERLEQYMKEMQLVPVNLRSTLEGIMKPDQTREILASTRRKFHAQLQSIFSEVKQGGYIQSHSDAYLAGVLSNLGVTQFEMSGEHDYVSGSALLSPGQHKDQEMLLSLELLNDENMVAASEAIQIKKSIAEHAVPVEHSFSIVYNVGNEKDGLAVATSSSKQRYLNTENVRAICKSGLRRKRTGATTNCQVYNGEGRENEYEKLNEHGAINIDKSKEIDQHGDIDHFIPDFDDLLAPAGDANKPSTVQWLDKNPLARVRFDEPINDLVSHHLSRDHASPFKSSNVRSYAAKQFYTSFFLGLLTAENAKQESGIISMYKRKTLNTLELLVVYGSKNRAALHVHKIDFGGAFGDLGAKERDSLDGRGLAVIKRNIEESQQISSIDEVDVYKYKLVELEQPINAGNDKVRFKMIDIDNHAGEAKSMDSSVEIDEVNFGQYSPVIEFPTELESSIDDWNDFEESLREFSMIKNEPDIVDLHTTVENFLIPTYRAKRLVQRMPEPLSPETAAADIGFLHGALFTVFPDNYYKRLMSNDLELIHCNEGVAHLYLPASSKMFNEHVLVDFNTNRITTHEGYHLLKYLKDREYEPKILEIRFFVDETGAPGDGVRLRTLEWNINNVVENFHLDALEAKIEGERQITVVEEEQVKANYDKFYSEIIQDIKNNGKFGHLIDSSTSLKSFILGQLKTNPNSHARTIADPRPTVAPVVNVDPVEQVDPVNPADPINPIDPGNSIPPADRTDPLWADPRGFEIKYNTGRDSIYFITFDHEYNPPPKPFKELIEQHSLESIFRLNFRFVDGQMQYTLTSMNQEEYATFNNRLRRMNVFQVGLKPTLEEIIEPDQTPEMRKNIKTKFHTDLQSIFFEVDREYIQSTSDVFLAGALSNLGVTQFDISRDHDLTSGVALLSQGLHKDQEILLSLELLNEENMVAVSEAIEIKKSIVEHATPVEHTFSIVYNLGNEKDGLAVAASSSKQLYLNTDNVRAVCESGSRRKRNGVPYCQLYKEESHEDEHEKINEDDKSDADESEKSNKNEIENDDESKEIYHEQEQSEHGFEKINYEKIENGIARKFPSLHEHISLLHKVGSNLQLGFLARDMFGNAYQKNLEGFVESVFFFGAAVGSSMVGKAITLFGQSQKIAGRPLTGKVLGTVGGCLPSVPFDVYMAYQQLKNNNNESAIFTYAYIGLDLIQCALTILDVFEVLAVNPVTFEFFAIPAAILMVVQNAINIYKKMKEIDQIVHLSVDEKMYEIGREVLFMGTDSTIQSMMDAVSANEAAVVSSFKMYQQFHRFLISGARKVENEGLIYMDDNSIDLTKTYRFNKSRLMPRENFLKPNFTTFCAMNEEFNPGEKELEGNVKTYHNLLLNIVAPQVSLVREYILPPSKPYTNEINDFLCKHIFGVADRQASETSKTLYQLFNGTDYVIAFPTVHNVFLLMNGNKSITGGVMEDEFNIKAEYIFGYLNGSDGEDVADFSASDAGKDLVIQRGEAFFSPKHGNNHTLKLYSIESIIGRQSLSDYIEVCKEKKIDLGGSTYGMDRINISQNCHGTKRNLTIVLRKNTFVTCDAQDSVVRYIVTDGSESDLVINGGVHEMYVSSVDYFDLSIRAEKYFREIKFGNSSKVRFQTNDMSNITLILIKENITMKMDNDNNITLYLNEKKTVAEVIEMFAEYVEHNSHVKVIAKSDDGRIILDHNVFTIEHKSGSKPLNVVSNGRKNKVQLVGHKRLDNYFSISDQDEMILLNITIHSHLSKFSYCYIDLHDLAQDLHKFTKGGHGLFIRSQLQAEDIVLKIFILSNTEKTNIMSFKGQIVIKDGYRYADRIKVHMYSENMFINSKDTVVLKPSPIHVNKSFVILFPGNLEFHSEINFQYSAENLKPYRLDKSLLLTNLLPLEKASTGQPVTVVLIDYFAYEAKYNTFSLIFNGKKSYLSLLVKHTKDIQSLWIDINEAVKDPKIVAPVA